jgi:multidrug resistance efflux pump
MTKELKSSFNRQVGLSPVPVGFSYMSAPDSSSVTAANAAVTALLQEKQKLEAEIVSYREGAAKAQRDYDAACTFCSKNYLLDRRNEFNKMADAKQALLNDLVNNRLPAAQRALADAQAQYNSALSSYNSYQSSSSQNKVNETIAAGNADPSVIAARIQAEESARGDDNTRLLIIVGGVVLALAALAFALLKK